MALPFNPFEKSKARPEAPRKFTKVKVFERADFEISEVQPEPANASGDNISANDVLTSSDAQVFHAEALDGGKSSELSNLGQTSDNPKTEPRTNLGQSSDKLRTPVASKTEPRTNLGQTSDNPKTEPRTSLRTNLGQTSDKLRTISGFQALSGLQREIALLMYEMCLLKGGRITGAVSIDHLCFKLNSTRLSLQKSIQRLEQKKILVRRQSRSGRGGWTVYELPENVWNQIFQTETSDKLRTNLGQTSDNPKTEPKTEPRTSPPSSSRGVFLNNSTTTTRNVDNFGSDADALKNFDFSIVTEFGITSSTLSRCRELYPMVSNDQLAALTERFGKFMKTTGGKRVQNARGFFISLAEQLSRGIVPLDHIETQDEALMREFVEQAKEAKARRELLGKEAFEFAFEEWVESLDSKSRDELVPPSSVIESGSKIQTMKLKEHFRLSVWPTRFAISKEAHGAET